MRTARLLLILLAGLVLTPIATAEDTPVWGEFRSDSRGIQVAPRAGDLLEVVVFQGGLPGDGWDGTEPQRFEADADEARDLVEGMKRARRVSPTEGAKPPAGAIVLYGGPDDIGNWEGGKVVEGDLLFAGARTKRTHGDATIHLEFLVPFQPERLGNFPGNSGVYLQDRYEIQILDDFGQSMRENLAGAIYRRSEPRLNACYPPGRWQTLDIEFTAARFDDEGRKTAPARITARQNGILIHDDVTVDGVTGGHVLDESAEPGPLYLQYHSDPVKFRNVWMLEREESAALRPVVPAYERYAAVSPPEEAGQWLISELSCTACHVAGGPLVTAARSRGPDLSKLSERVRPGWLVEYLTAPHAVKPGTTMPDMLRTLPADERRQAAKELAAFLMPRIESTGPPPVSPFAVLDGRRLYNAIGCGACHAPGGDRWLRTNVPLGPIREKWTADALAAFLIDPHASRPSGRMPSMRLTAGEASTLAAFLLRPPDADLPEASLEATVYHFSASSLAEFDDDIRSNEPVAKRPVDSFNINSGPRKNNFAVRFEGTFLAAEEGRFSFRIGADDGVRARVDGETLATVDGTGPTRFDEGQANLEAGHHAFVVDYYQAGGNRDLVVEWKRPGDTVWTPLADIFPPPDGETSPDEPADPDPLDASLADAGRQRFAELGCANCHAADGEFASLTAPRLADCDVTAGCLDRDDRATPRYDLTAAQVDAIRRALSDRAEPAAEAAVRFGLATRSCIACHARGTFGGAEPSRDRLFTSAIPEMGEEGRLPPKLDHVGDKLKAPYLHGTITGGLDLRPYVRTRMPVTHDKALADLLTPRLVELDRVDSPLPELPPPARTVHAAGRLLVGESGLACTKCHSFGPYEGTGIQAVNLLSTAPRIRGDWFSRYLPDPAALRPGTRMPTGFPNGKSVIPDLYDGDPARQTAAILAYLNLGPKAAVPRGLLPDPIELVPSERPVVYRNFLTGLDPRGMAVGYPERVHVAWDLSEGSVRRVWTGAFVDASTHWRGRGQGTVAPLGDNVVEFPAGPDILVDNAAEGDQRFVGYRLDDAGRPTLRFVVGGLTIEDTLTPIETPPVAAGALRRTVVADSADGRTYRVDALSGGIRADGDGFVSDRGVRVRILSGAARIESDHLIIDSAGDRPSVTYEIIW